jgi:hypothetical protein
MLDVPCASTAPVMAIKKKRQAMVSLQSRLQVKPEFMKGLLLREILCFDRTGAESKNVEKRQVS